MSVVKRGSQWCVVHGPRKPGSKTDKPEGTTIKCFKTKAEALRMHAAIILNEGGSNMGKEVGEQTLLEIIPFNPDMRIDDEKGIIHDVRVLNRSSLHERDYSVRAMDDVVRLVENAHVYDQHNKDNGGRRPIRDQLGMLRNARKINEGVIADFHVSARERWLLEDAKRMPDSLMLSINALGKLRRVSGSMRLLVESVKKLDSVDLVPKGGTTKSLFEGHESEQEEDDMDMEKLTLATIRESRPDLLEEHRTSVKSVIEAESEAGKALAEATQSLKELKESSAEQKKKLDEYAVKDALAQKQAKVAELVEGSKLPEEALTDEFKDLLESLPDEKAIKAALDDRMKLVESMPKGPINRPRSGSFDKELPSIGEFVSLVES